MKKVAEVLLDIDIGDIVLTGRYKNKRKEVKELGTDELGQPTINGQKLLAIRIEKKMPKNRQSAKTQNLAKSAGTTMEILMGEPLGLVKKSIFGLFEDKVLTPEEDEKRWGAQSHVNQMKAIKAKHEKETRERRAHQSEVDNSPLNPRFNEEGRSSMTGMPTMDSSIPTDIEMQMDNIMNSTQEGYRANLRIKAEQSAERLRKQQESQTDADRFAMFKHNVETGRIPGYEHGKTDDQLFADYTAWEGRNQQGTAPALTDPTTSYAEREEAFKFQEQQQQDANKLQAMYRARDEQYPWVQNRVQQVVQQQPEAYDMSSLEAARRTVAMQERYANNTPKPISPFQQQQNSASAQLQNTYKAREAGMPWNKDKTISTVPIPEVAYNSPWSDNSYQNPNNNTPQQPTPQQPQNRPQQQQAPSMASNKKPGLDLEGNLDQGAVGKDKKPLNLNSLNKNVTKPYGTGTTGEFTGGNGFKPDKSLSTIGSGKSSFNPIKSISPKGGISHNT